MDGTVAEDQQLQLILELNSEEMGTSQSTNSEKMELQPIWMAAVQLVT